MSPPRHPGLRPPALRPPASAELWFLRGAVRGSITARRGSDGLLPPGGVRVSSLSVAHASFSSPTNVPLSGRTGVGPSPTGRLGASKDSQLRTKLLLWVFNGTDKAPLLLAPLDPGSTWRDISLRFKRGCFKTLPSELILKFTFRFLQDVQSRARLR